MSQEQEVKGIEAGGEVATKKKSGRGKKIAKYTGLAVLLILLTALLVNACLSLFMPHYYPTFGGYRMFAIVSDSMDPTIPKGHMIVDKAPTTEEKDKIKVGTVITFEVKDRDGKITVLTHRVQGVTVNPTTGKTSYTTKGDNKNVGVDSIHPDYDDVVGIYTGKHCGFFGYLFGFLQSLQGAITLIIILFIILIAWIVIAYVKHYENKKRRKIAALKKSAQELSNVNLRYDNIREIAAVMDVIDMVTADPQTMSEHKELNQRLDDFINAETIELPQTPETAAVLDSLPAPDTPMTLAAALRNGATLRQAEDGQTLVLTGMSGGKSFLLTPVQTPDGIILCQQGVRLRSDFAPNIESVGATSMPEYPEFFEGQPLEKNVHYPELPEPDKKFGPEALMGGGVSSEPALAKELASPTPIGPSHVAALDGTSRRAIPSAAAIRAMESRSAYASYRETAAVLELRQVEELNTLLNSTEPLTQDERDRVAEYREELKRQNAGKRKKLTPEQLAARRAAAAKKKEEQEAFVNALDPADRELYLSEQKLAKSRAATIRRLKRINADRKLLDKMQKE